MRKIVIPIVVAGILALSFVMVANILSGTAITIKNKGFVSVKGFAKQEITSDLAIFEARIEAEDPVLKECYTRLAQDKKKMERFLTKKHNISTEEIKIEPATIREVYKINDRGFATDEFVKFALKQNFKVESDDVDKIAKLSSEMVDILDEEVRVSIADPEYVYTKLDELKVEMIGRATDNARQRAKIIAEKGKFRLGSIASVRVGIFQITPIHSTKVSGYGINDTSSIDKEIKSVVEIRYFVK